MGVAVDGRRRVMLVGFFVQVAYDQYRSTRIAFTN